MSDIRTPYYLHAQRYPNMNRYAPTMRIYDFFHPDFNRRYRNSTDSVPFGSRGLSPPVGNYTLP